MKRNAIICAALLTLAGGSAFAANQGGYAGIGLGGSNSKLNVFDKDDKSYVAANKGSISNEYSSVAGRIFGGYNITENFGVEVGYNNYGTSKQTVKMLQNIGVANQEVKYKLSSLDVRGKAYLPLLDNNANIYALAGAAYVKQDVESHVADPNNLYRVRTNELKSNKRVRPVVGLGANYNVTPQVTAGVEFAHVKGFGKLDQDKPNNKAMPNINSLMFTVAYNFG